MRRNVFDDIAHNYDHALPAHVSRHYLEKRIRFFSRYLKQHAKVLDVGCGTGRFILNLSREDGLTAYGCDVSMQMLKNAVKAGNPRIICCLSERLPYMDNTFDLVVSVAVFHHLDSQEAVRRTIDEMLRVTKKGGRVVIWDANPLNPYWRLLFKRVAHDKEVMAPVPLKKIILKSAECSLEKIEVFKNGWIPDFIPEKLLPFFKFLEYILERAPVIKLFSAHNVIVFTK